MFLYRGHSASMPLRKQEGVEEKSNKKWYRTDGVLSKKVNLLFSVTQSIFLLGFSRSSDSTTASNKKSTSKKEATSASEITL